MSIRVRTEYSLLKSLLTQQEYIEFLNQNPQIPLVICEYNSIRGVNKLAINETITNLKILGMEIEYKNEHLLVFAKNFKGYQIISHLSTIINTNLELPTELIDENIIIIPIKTTIKHLNQLKSKFDIIDHPPVVSFKKKELIYLDYFTKIDQFSYNEQVLSLEQVNFNSAIITELTNLVEKYNLLVKYDNHGLNKFSNDDYTVLVNKLKTTIITKQIQLTPDFKARIKKELKVIKKLNFASYFLIVRDIIEFCQANNIMYGFGRGSAAGSLIAYLLEITKVNPLEYNLIFERFLNEERQNFPDIDLDICDNKRHLVIEYLQAKYANCFSQILTFTNFGKKVICTDFARTMNLSQNDQDLLKIAIKNQEKFNYGFENPLITNDLIKLLNKLSYIPRQVSVHAAGVIISNQNLTQLYGVELKNNTKLISLDHHDVAKVGLVKFDLLGLSNLRMLENLKQNIKLTIKGKDLLNNQAVFEQFTQGETDQIFQFESPGVRQALQKIKPRTIQELADVTALYRPGPMQNIDLYARNKAKNITQKYPIEEISLILKPTYGIIIYQEQVIEIFQKLANISLAKADLIRIAISKRDTAKMDQAIKMLQAEMQKKYSKQIIDQLISDIITFGKYGFNKSHAISYVMISYFQMLYKITNQAVFEILCLPNQHGQINSNFYTKLRLKNTPILVPKFPHINSGLKFEEGVLKIGLSNIKGIGPELSQKISNLDPSQISDIRQFIYLTKINQTQFINLIKINYFAHFKYSTQTLLIHANALHKMSNNLISSQINELIKLELLESSERKINELIKDQVDLIGYSEYFLQLKDFYITQIDKITTRNNKNIYHLLTYSKYGMIKIIMFENDYQIILPQVGKTLQCKPQFETYRGEIRIVYKS